MKKIHEKLHHEINLRGLYNKYNREIFNNQLPNDLQLKWTTSTKRLGCARSKRYRLPDGSTKLIPIRITMSKSYNMDEDDYSATLIHEMIHIQFFTKNSNQKHGIKFKRRVQQIRSMGYPVSFRGDRPQGLSQRQLVNKKQQEIIVFDTSKNTKPNLKNNVYFKKLQDPKKNYLEIIHIRKNYLPLTTNSRLYIINTSSSEASLIPKTKKLFVGKFSVMKKKQQTQSILNDPSTKIIGQVYES